MSQKERNHPGMTEKLLSGTLTHNQIKESKIHKLLDRNNFVN